MSEAIWVTWENQTRNRSLSTKLGVDLYVFLSEQPRLARYIVCACKTLAVVWRKRPAVVFAQNPSIVLVYLLLLFKHLFRYLLVIDAHYVGIVAPRGRSLFQAALDFCNRHSDFVIVTNEAHRSYIESVGGRALTCEDPLPDIRRYARTVPSESRTVFLICSFDKDEPYACLLEATRILENEGFVFCMSGNYKKAGISPKDWPRVQLMGYIPQSDFYERLGAAQIVVDLTDNENCLLCGAYEAMALEKPLVTSKTFSLQKYFTGGTVFVEHRPEAIADGIKRAYERRQELRRQIKDWKPRAMADNAKKIEAIRAALRLS